MKTTKILGMLAAGLLAIAAAACSDNTDTTLEPLKTQRTLDVTCDKKEIPNHTLNLGAAPSNTKIEVKSNTRWTVEVTDCLGGWCDVDILNATGDGSFTIKVLDNMKAERSCYVTIYKTDAQGNKEVDGSYQLKVAQAVSNVRLSPSSLEPFAASGNDRVTFSIVANVDWTLDVTKENETDANFITITPISGMDNDEDGTYRGNGEASFYLDVTDNRTARNRKAFLNLHSAVGEFYVEINQNEATYTFDVTPAENQRAKAEGDEITFGVQSLSDWNITSSIDWITFSQTSGVGSADPVYVVAHIGPNDSGFYREAVINFTPTNKNYKEQPVTVMQYGYDLAFSVTSDNHVSVVDRTGENLGLQLNSRFDWVSDAPNFIRVEPAIGSASDSYQGIEIQVEPNNTNDNRNGSITLTPIPTQFAGGVILDPKKMGFFPITIDITQFGGQEPAISTPWLVDGYGQTYATVEFGYYSPFYNVVAAGLQWRLAGSSEWITEPATFTDPVDGMASVDLTDLNPATQYEARGFVRDSQGNTVFGSISLPFTTAGVRPGANDNPTPTN